MSSRDCKGYTYKKVSCTECDFEDSLNNTTAIITGAKFQYEDGQKCEMPNCTGLLTVEEVEVDEDTHKKEYLNYHADDEYDKDR
jgi:hypothetical protein